MNDRVKQIMAEQGIGQTKAYKIYRQELAATKDAPEDGTADDAPARGGCSWAESVLWAADNVENARPKTPPPSQLARTLWRDARKNDQARHELCRVTARDAAKLVARSKSAEEFNDWMKKEEAISIAELDAVLDVECKRLYGDDYVPPPFPGPI